MNVLAQGNLIEFFDILRPTLEFDLFEQLIDWDDQQVLLFNETALESFKDEFRGQAQDIGYESYNFIILGNTIALVLCFYFAKVALYISLRIIILLSRNQLKFTSLRKYLE